MRQTLKKILMLICLTTAGMLSVNAEELQEVVYLKNGSVIRGVILELVPEKSVKIQTSDGNIFVYEMSQVEKIAKEKPYRQSGSTTWTTSDTYNYNYNYGSRHGDSRGNYDYEPYGWEKAPRYRGFLNLSTVIGLGNNDWSRIMLSTTHGVQITPEIFAGVGIGVMGWIDYEDYWEGVDDYTSVPIFANVRGELHNVFRKNFSPYLDVKLGYSIADVRGVFFSPEVGCHFYFGHKKIGLGFGIGYHLQSAEVTYCSGYYDGYNDYHGCYSTREILNGLSINVAFDF